MRLLRSSFNRLLAVMALAAVLLGTLEHEDLIFQDAAPEPGALPSTHADGFATPPHDTGTEGVFRSDPYRLWLSPRPSLISASRLHVPTFARWFAPAQPDRPTPRAFIGLVALRL